MASLFVPLASVAGEMGIVSRGTGELGLAEPFVVAVDGASRVDMAG